MGRASYNARHGRRSLRTSNNPLLTDFCGMQLNSPIVLLSGCVGFGEEYTRVEGFSNRDVGAIVLKGTTGNRTARQPAAPRLRNAVGHAERDRVAESRRGARGQEDPADARLQRDAFLRERLRLDHRGVRGGYAALRRLTYRRHRDQHFLSEREGRRRGFRQLSGHVGKGGRGVPQGDQQTHHHQAVAEPDGHQGERAPLHRGGLGRPRGDQHHHGHGHRRDIRVARLSAICRAGCRDLRSSRSRC